MKKKLLFSLTDRCWIPVFLMGNPMRKWLAFMVILIVAFVLWWFLVAALSQDEFFFTGWNPIRLVLLPNGFQGTLENPDPQAKIKVVVVMMDFDFNVLSYWFFDGKGQAQVWKAGRNGYERDRNAENRCVRCHQRGVAI